MKEDCTTCLYKEGSCYPSGTIFDKDKKCKSYEPDPYDKIAELKAQIEKMKKQKVFLLQIVDTDDHTIDEQFYTTDEEIAKEWDKYYKPNYCYGQAIELEEFSDKERVREKLGN